MKFVEYKVTKADGTMVEAKIAEPETFEELCKIYPVERAFILAKAEYLKKAIKRLKTQRQRRILLKLSELTVEQQVLLRKAGLLKFG